jgi:hypothetical protein
LPVWRARSYGNRACARTLLANAILLDSPKQKQDGLDHNHPSFLITVEREHGAVRGAAAFLALRAAFLAAFSNLRVRCWRTLNPLSFG